MGRGKARSHYPVVVIRISGHGDSESVQTSSSQRCGSADSSPASPHVLQAEVHPQVDVTGVKELDLILACTVEEEYASENPPRCTIFVGYFEVGLVLGIFANFEFTGGIDATFPPVFGQERVVEM